MRLVSQILQHKWVQQELLLLQLLRVAWDPLTIHMSLAMVEMQTLELVGVEMETQLISTPPKAAMEWWSFIGMNLPIHGLHLQM